MTRVVVIGGGIAGYCAALGARREGAEVTVAARAPGATALYAGAMEVVDDLDVILKTQPHHPFTRLGLDGVRLSSELDQAIQALLVALEKDGLKVEGTWRTRGAYADIHGIARPGNPVVGGGEVTSGTLSPCLGVGIGLAYVPSAAAVTGTRLEIDVRGKMRAAVVKDKPLYTKPPEDAPA